MDKLWTGRSQKPLSNLADAFNSSIEVDGAMWREDIEGSIAHIEMLRRCKIIESDKADAIKTELYTIEKELHSGLISIDKSFEDIHSFIEGELTRRLGDTGKMLHTARSRNDQVALDLKLYLRKKNDLLLFNIKQLVLCITDIAEKGTGFIMPGYTHLQRAQPVTFGHHIMAYSYMLIRDIQRLKDAKKRLNYCPLGSSALAGTTYNINRALSAELLHFEGVTQNSIDGVSDRDFAVELLCDIAILMMHLSRFCEEIVLWCSYEFRYIELDDAYSTGSSIMPQKKNPDIAELIRGKTGRSYGNLMALLTILKGLPLAYNKDMQEDKEAIFDSFETAINCTEIFTSMLKTAVPLPDNMRRAADTGLINATDCADYLTQKGLPFRDAYKITGKIAGFCTDNKLTFESLSLSQYKEFSEVFEDDVYDAVKLENCVMRRVSQGGTAPDSVAGQIKEVRELLLDD